MAGPARKSGTLSDTKRALKFLGILSVRIFQNTRKSPSVWSQEFLESAFSGAVQELPPGPLKQTLQSDPKRFSKALADRFNVLSKYDIKEEEEVDKDVTNAGQLPQSLAQEKQEEENAKSTGQEEDFVVSPEDRLDIIETGELFTDRGYLKAVIAAIESVNLVHSLNSVNLVNSAKLITSANMGTAISVDSSKLHSGTSITVDSKRLRSAFLRCLRARQDPPWELWSAYSYLVWKLKGGTEETFKFGRELSLHSWKASINFSIMSDSVSFPNSFSTDITALKALWQTLKTSSCLFRSLEFAVGALEPLITLSASLILTVSKSTVKVKFRKVMKSLKNILSDMASTVAVRRLLSVSGTLNEDCFPPPPPIFPSGFILNLNFEGEKNEKDSVSEGIFRASNVMGVLVFLRIVVEVLIERCTKEDRIGGGGGNINMFSDFDWNSDKVVKLRQLAFQSVIDLVEPSLETLLDLLLCPRVCFTSNLEENEEKLVRGVLYEAVLFDVNKLPGIHKTSIGNNSSMIYLKKVSLLRKSVAFFRKEGERSRAIAMAASSKDMEVPRVLTARLATLKEEGKLPHGVSLPSSSLEGKSKALTALLIESSGKTLLQMLLSSFGDESSNFDIDTTMTDIGLSVSGGEGEREGDRETDPNSFAFFVDTKGDKSMAGSSCSREGKDGEVGEEEEEVVDEGEESRAFALAAAAMRVGGERTKRQRKSDVGVGQGISKERSKRGKHEGRGWGSEGDESEEGSGEDLRALAKQRKERASEEEKGEELEEEAESEREEEEEKGEEIEEEAESESEEEEKGEEVEEEAGIKREEEKERKVEEEEEQKIDEGEEREVENLEEVGEGEAEAEGEDVDEQRKIVKEKERGEGDEEREMEGVEEDLKSDIEEAQTERLTEGRGEKVEREMEEVEEATESRGEKVQNKDVALKESEEENEEVKMEEVEEETDSKGEKDQNKEVAVKENEEGKEETEMEEVEEEVQSKREEGKGEIGAEKGEQGEGETKDIDGNGGGGEKEKVSLSVVVKDMEEDLLPNFLRKTVNEALSEEKEAEVEEREKLEEGVPTEEEEVEEELRPEDSVSRKRVVEKETPIGKRRKKTIGGDDFNSTLFITPRLKSAMKGGRGGGESISVSQNLTGREKRVVGGEESILLGGVEEVGGELPGGGQEGTEEVTGTGEMSLGGEGETMSEGGELLKTPFVKVGSAPPTSVKRGKKVVTVVESGVRGRKDKEDESGSGVKDFISPLHTRSGRRIGKPLPPTSEKKKGGKVAKLVKGGGERGKEVEDNAGLELDKDEPQLGGGGVVSEIGEIVGEVEATSERGELFKTPSVKVKSLPSASKSKGMKVVKEVKLGVVGGKEVVDEAGVDAGKEDQVEKDFISPMHTRRGARISTPLPPTTSKRKAKKVVTIVESGVEGGENVEVEGGEKNEVGGGEDKVESGGMDSVKRGKDKVKGGKEVEGGKDEVEGGKDEVEGVGKDEVEEGKNDYISPLHTRSGRRAGYVPPAVPKSSSKKVERGGNKSVSKGKKT